MELVSFSALPDHSRLWIFTSDTTIGEEKQPAIRSEVEDFLRSWNAHGKPVEAGYELREGKFLMIGASDRAEDPSGCSIDALTRFVRSLGETLGYNFMSSPLIHYRTESGEIVSVPRPAFKQQAAEGSITSSTIVYDASLSKLSELRAGKLEMPAGKSWHASAFGIQTQ